MGGFEPLVGRELAHGLFSMGISAPNAIQADALRISLSGQDVIVVAQTGSGKTCIFLLTMLRRLMDERLGNDDCASGRALVIVPTVELARQHRATAAALASSLLRPLIIGNLSAETSGAADVLIGTVAEVLTLARATALSTLRLRCVAFDECDAALCMPDAWQPGWTPEGAELLSQLSAIDPPAQAILTTAHLSREHERTLSAYFGRAGWIRQTRASGAIAGALVPTLRQRFVYFSASSASKQAKLVAVLEASNADAWLAAGRTIVVCEASDTVRQVHAVLECSAALHTSVAMLHAELSNADRFAALQRFESRESSVLVISGSVARGLDFGAVRHVVMYDMTDGEAAFIHCAGRTARRGEHGLVTCLIPSSSAVGQFRKVHALEAADPLHFERGADRTSPVRLGLGASTAAVRDYCADNDTSESMPMRPWRHHDMMDRVVSQ
jgi:superfamily II DNA/RNA helicase